MSQVVPELLGTFSFLGFSGQSVAIPDMYDGLDSW